MGALWGWISAKEQAMDSRQKPFGRGQVALQYNCRFIRIAHARIAYARAKNQRKCTQTIGELLMRLKKCTPDADPETNCDVTAWVAHTLPYEEKDYCEVTHCRGTTRLTINIGVTGKPSAHNIMVVRLDM